MSELSKRIGRVSRRETVGGLGFGAAKREQPRAMLLAARVKDAASAKSAIAAGADLVILDGVQPGSAKSILDGLDKVCAGALVGELDEKSAATLHEAGLDFVISPLATTASAAVDTEKMGQVVSIGFDIPDSALRALGPLGLDALYVEGEASAPTLAGQLELARLSSFSGIPLAVNVQANVSPAQLRVLRDAGAAVAVAPASASDADLKKLGEALVAVPAPRRASKGGEIALVPSITAHAADDDEIEEPE